MPHSSGKTSSPLFRACEYQVAHCCNISSDLLYLNICLKQFYQEEIMYNKMSSVNCIQTSAELIKQVFCFFLSLFFSFSCCSLFSSSVTLNNICQKPADREQPLTCTLRRIVNCLRRYENRLQDCFCCWFFLQLALSSSLQNKYIMTFYIISTDNLFYVLMMNPIYLPANKEKRAYA